MIQMSRTLNLPQGPLDDIPPATIYDCLRTSTPIRIDGTLNCPDIVDNGWPVEFALPWESLKALQNPNTPPKPDDVWRIGASRCQHFHDEEGNNISVDWSWNRHGTINMHVPERWTQVRFVDQVV